jgi:hypothetical protein
MRWKQHDAHIDWANDAANSNVRVFNCIP